jgi:putative membrane protein insertion efficiency factor
MKYILLLLIKFYKYAISPYLGRSCRFYPTCSTYGYEAISTHGALYGSFLTIKRILRCHPFRHGGYDPVPEKPELVEVNLINNYKSFVNIKKDF